MSLTSSIQLPINKINGSTSVTTNDVLASEEPLEIRLEYGTGGQRMQKAIAVTMRTPGNDDELASGFLFTEGIITSKGEIKILPV